MSYIYLKTQVSLLNIIYDEYSKIDTDNRTWSLIVDSPYNKTISIRDEVSDFIIQNLDSRLGTSVITEEEWNTLKSSVISFFNAYQLSPISFYKNDSGFIMCHNEEILEFCKIGNLSNIRFSILSGPFGQREIGIRKSKSSTSSDETEWNSRRSDMLSILNTI